MATSEDDTWKVIVTVKMRTEIMEEHHDSKGAGHIGVMKTHERLRKSPYYWPEMRKAVEKWINSCNICQSTKPAIRKEVAPLGKIHGRRANGKDSYRCHGTTAGNRKRIFFTVVIGDYFTK